MVSRVKLFNGPYRSLEALSLEHTYSQPISSQLRSMGYVVLVIFEKIQPAIMYYPESALETGINAPKAHQRIVSKLTASLGHLYYHQNLPSQRLE